MKRMRLRKVETKGEEGYRRSSRFGQGETEKVERRRGWAQRGRREERVVSESKWGICGGEGYCEREVRGRGWVEIG